MHNFGNALERIGKWLVALGVLSAIIVMIIVVVNGTWPEFLHPVQHHLQLLYSMVGSLNMVVIGIALVGPGIAINALGTWMKR